MRCDLCSRLITPGDAGQSTNHTVICEECMDRLDLESRVMQALIAREEVPTNLPQPDAVVVG